MRAIVAALGKDAVIRTVANPFAFFRAYNEAAAAKPGGAPAFSPESMAFLLALEKRYQLE